MLHGQPDGPHAQFDGMFLVVITASEVPSRLDDITQGEEEGQRRFMSASSSAKVLLG